MHLCLKSSLRDEVVSNSGKQSFSTNKFQQSLFDLNKSQIMRLKIVCRKEHPAALLGLRLTPSINKAVERNLR